MIHGLRKDLINYKGINKHLDDAIDFLTKEDLNKLEVGANKIDDYIVISKLCYQGKAKEDVKPEEHKHHLDLQMVLKGRELFYYDYLRDEDLNCVAVPYNEIKDVIKFDRDLRFELLSDSSNFTLFLPHDVHQPGVKIDDEEIVKLVIKVLID